MDNFIAFITFLAWPIGLFNAVLCVLRMLAYFMYDDEMQLEDRVRGITRKFPIMEPALAAMISFSWIVFMGDV
jgi:hypothetical protein